MDFFDALANLPAWQRISIILILAALGHFAVRLLKRGAGWLMEHVRPRAKAGDQQYPRLATLITIVVSTITFVIYFMAIGMVFREFGIQLTAYMASASVIALAVGFGSQGLVQDVVLGLTLIFTDVLDVGDMVEVSGQIGRVDRVGLRFTVLTNYVGQSVFVPNRNIALISRYRGGAMRAYVDVQLPDGTDEAAMRDLLEPMAEGLQQQFQAALPTPPEVFGSYAATPGDWHYLRIKFRLWPGQQTLIETTFRQRVLAAVKQRDPNYADYMVSVTYRVVLTPRQCPIVGAGTWDYALRAGTWYLVRSRSLC